MVNDGEAIDANSTCLGFVETGQEADDAGFSRAGLAHEGDGRAGGNGEMNVFENPPVGGRGVVAEADAFEGNVPAHQRQVGGGRGVFDLGFGVEEGEDAFGAGGGG